MSLFQHSVLKKYISDIDKETLHSNWLKFQSNFHNAEKQQNICNSKEEQYQEGFLRELFVDVLGYTLNPQPNFNLTTEYKNEKDSKKADGAVLHGEQVVAVIELKGTDTTDLNKVESQAFSYKNNQKGCTYIITSNFEKLRFYINDATDFEEFNLFTLSQEQFKLLYLCLQKDNLINHTPLQIKQASIAVEENITRKLYADYSSFKKKLYYNVVVLNPQHDKLLLFKKTQKLLDRFLFIFFAEDRLLLPPNSVREILKQWQQLKELDNYVPLYERFKKYFGYLNTGHQGKLYEIFAYNGGLFAPDELLDTLLIDDETLYQSCITISNYDFDTEVDVNILGHIFEHSLNEIEELQAELDGAAIDKSKTKRKKDGVFYTPRYITKYIVENTVGSLCEQKKTELKIIDDEFTVEKRKANKKKLLEVLENYRSWLLQLTICDPACGSGAFLNQALDFLLTEHRYVDELKARLFGDSIVYSDVEKEILENNLFGVDINDEAVEIAKLSLWLRTAHKGRKLNNLSNNIKCGNSLIDDATIAGDKAFNWTEEFPKVFEHGGFDVVIGNPPYGIIISNIEQEYYKAHFPLTDYKTNLYVLFLERVFKIFKNSLVSFIIPKSLLINSYYSSFRKYILENSTLVELFGITDKVFEDAEVGGSLIIKLVIENKELSSNKTVKLISTDLFSDYPHNCIVSEIEQTYFLCIPNNEISIVSSEIEKIKSKILKFNPLKDYYLLKNGLNPGNIKHILITSIKVDEFHKPIIWGKDIQKYAISWSGDYVNYNETLGNNLTAENIKSKNGMNAQLKIDFALRNKEIFEISKIIIRKTGDSLISAIDETNNFYFDTLVHGIYKKMENYSLKYLLVILNSAVATNFYRILHDIKGKVFAKISLDNLASFPIPNTNTEIQSLLIDYADIMLSNNLELQKLQHNFLHLFQSKFTGLQLTNKLKDWHKLSFGALIKELEKQKIKLSLSEQAEWMQYFESEKSKVVSIQNIITSTDKEIDAMVYALYGLTDEEIKIVEG